MMAGRGELKYMEREACSNVTVLKYPTRTSLRLNSALLKRMANGGERCDLHTNFTWRTIWMYLKDISYTSGKKTGLQIFY
jgi:hypothetical protein